MTRYRLQSILFVFVAFMLGCNEYMIVGVLPDIASEYHNSLASLGYLVTMFALIYAFFTPVITSLGNRWKRHKVLLALMVVFFVGNTWTALATNYTSLLLSRMLTATVAGAIISIVLVLANFIAPPEKRASLVSWVFAGFSLASVVGVPLGTMISQKLTWHDSFWIITWLTIVVFAMLVWLVPKDTPQVQGRLSSQFSLFKDKRVLAGAMFVVTVCAADYTMYTYIRPLISNLMGFNDTLLNWLLLMMGVFFLIGNKFGGFLADNGGVHRLPYLYILMTLLMLALGPSFPFKWLAITVVAILCVLFASYGASTQLMFLEIAEKKFPQSLDLASSINSIFANIGISLGSLAAAETVRFSSLSNVGNVGAVFGVIATILIFTVSKNFEGMRR